MDARLSPFIYALPRNGHDASPCGLTLPASTIPSLIPSLIPSQPHGDSTGDWESQGCIPPGESRESRSLLLYVARQSSSAGFGVRLQALNGRGCMQLVQGMQWEGE